MDIALIGGHGKIALLAEPLLTEAGHTVDAVIRNPEHAAEVEATGARAVVEDIEHLDADGWERLVRGHDVVVWSAGAGGGDPQRTWAVDRDAAIAAYDAAARAGVGRFIMVSYFGAGPDHGIPEDDDFYPYAQAKSEADAHLLEADGPAVTILRPSRLTLDEPSGRIDVAADSAGDVARADVARVIAAVIERDGLGGAVVEFNGGGAPIDEALTAVASRG
ncbi:NAD(P)H-binding protein [Brachybacterium nesterenkovii]|uniref:NAD(P)H-binding protein n=1 Tax=Brachybacterium nesterenkovii TaxID=47847 RepID=UPI00321C3834